VRAQRLLPELHREAVRRLTGLHLPRRRVHAPCEHLFYDGGVGELEPRRAPVTFDEEPCRTALNPVRGMPFRWSLNPYMGCEHRCTFCYVRAFERRADRPSGEGYGRTVRVKPNVAEVLRTELARSSWSHETVAIGAATDPYQPAEGHYRLTRGCLAALADHRTPASLITRSPLIVRDVDVLTELAGRAGVTVNFSVPTLDREVWRRTEPGTSPPGQRLRALARLTGAGIRAGVSMAPILPGLSDRPEQLDEVVRAARDAGAEHLWVNTLYLKEGTREHFMSALAAHWPELVPAYERDYGGRAYLPDARTRAVQEQVARLRTLHGLGLGTRRWIEPEPLPEPPQQLDLLAG
jgi:DNA repair photolyase